MKLMKQIISKNFLNSLRKYENMFRDEVKVGYPRPSTPYPGSDATVADVAMWNEFGVPGKNVVWKIQPRPFFRTAWNSFKAGMKDVLTTSIEMFKKGKYAKSLEFVAIMFQDEVRNQIESGNWKANHPTTIARKGSSRPLMDTGKLVQSVQIWRDA
jgi:hypothetical protein